MNTTALEALVASMPLSDLAQRSGRSVDEIVSWALSGASAPAAKAPAAAPPSRTPAKATETPKASAVIRRRGAGKAAPAPAPEDDDEEAGEVDTRTPAGRDRYDKAVLNMVLGASSPIAAATIRSTLGGTPLQVRAALNRLIEAGKVEYQGQARAMRYTAR